MPAYDRPIVFNTPEQFDRRPAPREVAAVIKFSSTDLDRINAYLAKLSDAGIITSWTARAYDGSITSPELYFP